MLGETAYTANITIEAFFTSTNTTYTVAHHQQNINNDEYTKFEEEILNGVIGSTTQAAEKSYVGFTAQTIAQVEIAAGNVTVVKVYYNRNINQVRFKESATSTEYFATLNVKYGASIPLPSTNPTLTGYDFDGWDLGNHTTMPNSNVDVLAKWSKKQTIITFDPNGGVMPSTSKIVAYGDLISVENPTWQDGTKTFVGWMYNGSDYSLLTSWQEEVANATFVAKWQDVDKYKITFAGGSGAVGTTPSLPDAVAGTIITFPINPYTKDGYTFVGWLTSGNDNPYTEGYASFQMPAHNVHFEAVWKINQYTYTFYNYDKSVMKQETVDYGSVITAPTTLPSRISDATYNYVFDKWDNFTQNMTIGSNNVEFNPLFTSVFVEYTIKFVGNDGTVYKETVYHYQDLIVPPTDPEKVGYTFVEWQNIETVVTKNSEFKALFVANSYTITLDANGGTVATTEIVVTFGAIYQLPVPTSANPFIGWEYQGVIVNSDKWDIAEGDITLTAKWKMPSEVYSDLEYILNDGILPTGAITQYLEGKEVVLPVPTRTGYTFEGWFKDESFNGSAIEKILSTDTGKQTYYAKWTLNSVTTYGVTFVSDLHTTGSVPVIANQESGSVIIIPNSNLARTGYRFVGWNDGMQTYIVGADYSINTKDVTFTAIWEVNQYTYTFYAEDGKP